MPKVLYFNLQDAFDSEFDQIDTELDKSESWILEPVDIPFWGTFGWEEEGWTMRMHVRRGLCTHDETRDYIGCIVSGDDTHRAKWPRGEADWSDWELTMVQMSEHVQKILRCLHAEHPEVLETDGEILCKFKEFEVTPVSGSRRPDLWCVLTDKLRGRMYRPYPEEAEQQTEKVRSAHLDNLKKAQQGDRKAMLEVAEYYLNNKPFEPADPEKAFFWYRELAEAGENGAVYQTMLMCGKGCGTRRDFGQMARWMQRYEGEKKFPDDMRYEILDAAQAREKGEGMTSGDLIKVANAILWMREYLPHVGEEQDCLDALELARKAVALGNADGYTLIGQAYDFGRGVEKDPEKALEYYRRAVEAGSPSGMMELARLCYSGDHVMRDPGGAFAWPLKAAEKEYLPAMKNLAFLYYEGTGTEKDPDGAEFWAKAYLEKR